MSKKRLNAASPAASAVNTSVIISAVSSPDVAVKITSTEPEPETRLPIFFLEVSP